MTGDCGQDEVDRREFLRAGAAGCLALGGDGVGVFAVPAPEARTIADEPQLFLDDWIIDRLAGLKRVLHQPEKKGLIKHADGSDWDRGDCHAYDGNAVCRDKSGRFHMTYRYVWWDPNVRHRAPVGNDKAHWFRQVVAYAYSDDGIRWQRPKLGLMDGPIDYKSQKEFPFEVPTGMSKQNNLGCPFDFIWDLNALGNLPDPNKRFLLRVVKKDDTHPFAKVVESAMYYAADWPDFANFPKWQDKLTPIPRARLSPRNHKGLCGYDAETKVWFQVCQDYVGNWLRRGGRDIARFTSPDLVTWKGPELVLAVAKDESRDPRDWVEYMGMIAYRVGGLRSGAWLGQLEIFHGDRTNRQYEVPAAGVWRKGTIEQRLVLSRDAGKSWQRVGGRQVWLPHHPEEHGYDRLASQAVPVRVGDEVWFYYAAWDGDHLIFHKDGSLYERGFVRTGRTARATLRLDGYVSLDAGKERGELRTKPLIFKGTGLVVNLKAPHGELRVELQDAAGQPIPRFAAADCRPIRGDGVALPVRWQGSPDLGKLAGKPVRLRFFLQDGSLYFFSFKD